MTDEEGPDSDRGNIPSIRHPILAVVWLSLVVVLGLFGVLSLSGRMQAVITPR